MALNFIATSMFHIPQHFIKLLAALLTNLLLLWEVMMQNQSISEINYIHDISHEIITAILCVTGKLKTGWEPWTATLGNMMMQMPIDQQGQQLILQPALIQYAPVQHPAVQQPMQLVRQRPNAVSIRNRRKRENDSRHSLHNNTAVDSSEKNGQQQTPRRSRAQRFSSEFSAAIKLSFLLPHTPTPPNMLLCSFTLLYL